MEENLHTAKGIVPQQSRLIDGRKGKGNRIEDDEHNAGEMVEKFSE
jgi:hypothetical protein